jgi:hypothetical protein
MGFRKGRRTADNIFILKTTTDKYLSRKRGKVYWLFIDLQKAFDTVVREALWWKLGTINKIYRGSQRNLQECKDISKIRG